MKNTFEFAADCITVNGKTFPARYEVTAEAVNVFATVTEDGKEKTVCIRIDAIDPLYGPASIAAAQPAEQEPQPEAEQAEEEAQQAEEAQAEPEAQQAEEEAQAEPEAQQAEEEAEQTAEEAQQAEEAQAEEAQAEPEAQQTGPEAQQTEPEAQQAAPDPKAARGPVPEKSFIGQSISGAGWSIVFDGGCNRTRVLVCKAQRDKLRGIIEKAGFYYSPTLDSWNKKLTFRAYRAAQALALELSEALAA